MASHDNRLDSARIASPCPASWEKMSGDDEVRFCDQCQLHVYDISRLTRGQAEALISRTEGRICARLFRRADGTILTKDCPVGLRAFRRRIARMATAAVTALLSLSASALGQNLTRTSRHDSINQRATATRTFYGLNQQEGRATLWGVITDPAGGVVPNAQATIINRKTKSRRIVRSDDEGQFKFGSLEPGSYTLKIESPGFQEHMEERLDLHSNEDLRFNVSLGIAEQSDVTVGVVVCERSPVKGIVIDGVRITINENRD